tara:strand:- start:423 stop:998 length:576 start_codon:yes stop_codon:yes gene_type:complete
MIIIAILGDIGSGKSFASKLFGHPVFNADEIVKRIYLKDKKCFYDLKKKFPVYIKSFPINKTELLKLILSNKNNLSKINKIVHPIVRKKLNIFLNKNKKKRLVILDIPLILENRIMIKKCIFVYIHSEKKIKYKRLIKRPGYNSKLFKIIKKSQLPLLYKRKMSKYIIKNNYKKNTVKEQIELIKKEIFNL